VKVTRFDPNDSLIIVHATIWGSLGGIQGLLGLSFLRQFNYEIRSAEGRIRAERIGP
jgi:hypothetical protein